MTMRTLLVVGLAALATMSCDRADPKSDATQASASRGLDDQGAPVVQPGLWEIVARSPLGFSERNVICTDDALDADRSNLQTDTVEGCEISRVAIPGGVRQMNRCQALNVRSATETTFVGGPEAFEVSSTVVLGEAGAVASTRKARRLGDCPAGLSDGDVVESTSEMD